MSGGGPILPARRIQLGVRAGHGGAALVDNRNDYMRRFQQNIHEEEIKIDPA